MKLKIIYHGNCFDGVASAAFFTNFYLSKINKTAEISYSPAMHQAGNVFDRDLLIGDENAIVDFKYCPDERLTWWFDHHHSAFLTPDDENHFKNDTSGKKFLDTNSKSCCEYIAKIAKEQFGYESDHLKYLVEWAHIIDGALYESPAQCVELQSSALKLMQLIENEKDVSVVEEIIKSLGRHSIDEILLDPFIAERLEPILERHWEVVDLVEQRAVFDRGVVSFDLTDTDVDSYNKFIPYYFFPQTTYNVALTRSDFRTKISVGSNPWAPRPRTQNIAELCERYGGGGHAVVGAVSLGRDEIEKGRDYMSEIIGTLKFND